MDKLKLFQSRKEWKASFLKAIQKSQLCFLFQDKSLIRLEPTSLSLVLRTSSRTIMGRPHLLVIPYPAQGHVMPLMELSHKLVDNGFKITFVNSDFNHKRVVDSIPKTEEYDEFVHLVSISDGMDTEEDRTDLERLSNYMMNVMPRHLEELVEKINESNNGDDKIRCLIADPNIGWALKVAKKMAIPIAAFWPASATFLATYIHIPKLIEQGIIDTDGIPIKTQKFHLCPTMPAINTADLIWLRMGSDLASQKSIFKFIVSNYCPTMSLTDYFLCNSFPELEPSTFTLLPNLKPIGPLLGSTRFAHFWPEDRTCLSWLDQQPSQSVIYIAFGSYTVMNKQQFHELALGLELSGQRFLWVVRPDLIRDKGQEMYPDGFEARVGSRGRLLGWAPQREVLAHPSIACFLTHCGWNSTMEGISVGVPLLCWPYFADQMLNKSYICDVWKLGLDLEQDENGFISREEINTKVVKLLGDSEIRASAIKYKEMANVSNRGESLHNFKEFVQGFLCDL